MTSAFLARWHRSILFAILCIALYLRLTSIAFGLPALNDPDELIFEMGALRMLRGATLNPGWFGHPATTTMYVLALTNISVFSFAYLFGWAGSVREFGDILYADPSWFILPGRIVMALFGIGSIFLTWHVARRLFGVTTGLAAALLLAVNPIHITYSQIIRSDMMACFFLLLCLNAAITIAERGRWRDYLFAALWLGLAVATKWPFALSGLAIAGATLVAMRSAVLSPRIALLRLSGAACAAVAVLLIVSPYLLIDHAVVIKNLQGEGQAHHLGATGGGFWHNLVWYASNPVRTGFGLAGCALILLGTARLVRHRTGLAIIAPVAIAFVVILCAQTLIWERWALPLMLFGSIVAALGIGSIAAFLAPRLRTDVTGLVLAAILIAVLVPLGLRIAIDDRMRMHDTRQQAAAWARQHIPTGSTVLIEHFAFDLIGEPWTFLFPMGDAGCVDVRAYLDGKGGYASIDQARGSRSNIDYGTVAPARRDSCRADYAILTQADRYHDERDHFPVEDAAYRSLTGSARATATFTPEWGRTGGPIVRIIRLR